MKAQFLILFAICGLTAVAEPLASPDAVVENYCAAVRDRQQSLREASMEVQIDASLPRLSKWGRLRALRHISKLGRITYDALNFEGDNTVKNNVIARYLTAETQSARSTELAVTPENYKFKFKRTVEWGDGQAYVYRVSPRRKKVGLFKGEIWIDAATYVCVQEAGRFVKNPSIFLKKIEFVRKFEIRDGVPVPLRIHSTVHTRLVGRAELTIDFSNFSLVEATKRASLADEKP